MNHISHFIPMHQQSYPPQPAAQGFGTIHTAPQFPSTPQQPVQPWSDGPSMQAMQEQHVCDHGGCEQEMARLRKALADVQSLVAAAMNAKAESGPSVVEVQMHHLAPSASDTEIEGVFDGQHMVAQDGQTYNVPPNYASKSKLVEGDMMKLTITSNGSQRYKQIGPTKRMRMKGALMQDPSTNQWQVMAGGKLYNILTASVTFHKGKPGDDVTILVPESGVSSWGAVEHIVHMS